MTEEEAKIVANGDVSHNPNKIKNSATKEDVNGNEKLANVRTIKKIEKRGNK